jgi:glucan biosynthesis protein C
MSLFFLLSGYFAKLVLDRKGVMAFLWGRVGRIAVPFVLFYPLLLGAMTAVIVFSLSYVEDPKGLMGVIATAVKGETTSAAAQTPTTMHLWFLYYLFMFNVLSAALYRVKLIRMDWLFARPIVWLFVPLLSIPGILGAGVPLPAPESFVPTWWPFAFFGLFYFVGWHLRSRELVLERLGPYLRHFVVVSLVLFVVYYWSMPTLDLSLIAVIGDSAEWKPYPLASLCTAYLSVLLTLSAILLGKRFMQRRNAALALIADASYWIYLVHLPIAIFLQTLLLHVDWPAELKLVVVLLGTTVPSMATYLVFVRYTPVGWLLHGKRSFP